MKTKKFVRSRLNSIAHALHGSRLLLESEINFRIHLLAAVVVVVAGVLTGLSASEWIVITGLIAMVWVLEAVNTVVEELLDLMEPGWSIQVKRIKDISAAAVLISSIASFAIGLLIFIPKWI
jgi:diacylglycerol kinase